MDDKTKHFADALTWIEQNAPDGVALVARALARTSPYELMPQPPHNHTISAACDGEECVVCRRIKGESVRATHKVGEEILHDDPRPDRHNLTAYVCCAHFVLVMGPAALRFGICGPTVDRPAEPRPMTVTGGWADSNGNSGGWSK